MTDSNSLSAFEIDGDGYAGLVRLIEARADKDIELTNIQLRAKKDAAISLQKKSDAWFRDWRKGSAEDKATQIEKTIADKRKWKEQWVANAFSDVSRMKGADVEAIKKLSIDEIRTRYNQTSELRSKCFLIVQDAVLTPLYAGTKLSEEELEGGCELVATRMGLPAEVGSSIWKNTNSLVRSITGYWTKVAVWTTAGTVAALLTAGMAGPAIAGAIGGVMGLHGAAAVAAGWAFLGGGSIAAGGLGMAGGIAVLTGGGALMGAAAGAGAGNMLGKVSTDGYMISAAKTVNYYRYLGKRDGDDGRVAKNLQNEVLSQFLSFKHSTERAVAENASIDLKDATKKVKILEHAFHSMLECR
jgi:hypothetical protein